MKVFTLSLLLAALVFSAYAQSHDASNAPDICRHLQQSGRVNLRQDSRLTELVNRGTVEFYVNAGKKGKDRLTTSGFRVRVYAGNKQNASKAEAYRLQRELQEFDPELETYVVFRTPFWRLMVGNYRTTEEANAQLRILKRQFPSLAGEMFIVKDEIEL